MGISPRILSEIAVFEHRTSEGIRIEIVRHYVRTNQIADCEVTGTKCPDLQLRYNGIGACLKTPTAPAARDSGTGRGGEIRASPSRSRGIPPRAQPSSPFCKNRAYQSFQT